MNKKILAESEVIIFSVGIRNTVNTIKTLSKHIIGDKLVMDVTGIKTCAMSELAKLNTSEIVGTHPMFLPFIETLKGQNIIYIPHKVGKKWNIIKKILEKNNVNLVQLNANEHDRKMAVIQGLSHIINLIFILVLQKLNMHPNQNGELHISVCEFQSLIAGRFLNQESGLYADMQIGNKIFIDEILPLLQKGVSEIIAIYKNGDKNNFASLIDELKEFLGEDFIKKSVEKTDLVDINFVHLKKHNLEKNSHADITRKLSAVVSIIFTSFMKDLSIHPTELEQFETPIYKLQSLISGRLLSHSTENIVSNHLSDDFFSDHIIPELEKSHNLMQDIDNNKKHNSFIDIFVLLSNFLGPEFKSQSLNTTLKIGKIL